MMYPSLDPSRRPCLLQLVIIVISTASSAISVTDATPNIIFAMADDLGWGDVEYNGGRASTPNLNKMACSDNSILLQRHYSGSPVCSPTRGTVLTGRNHNRYCVWGANGAKGESNTDFKSPQQMPLPLSEITVAKVLQKAGYSTALFGKWHLGDFKPLRGGNSKWPVSHPGLHGFDQWWATERSTPTATTNCGCFENSTCVFGYYQRRPRCTNYHTSTSNGIVGWPEPITGDDSHFIWSLAKKYIREQVNLQKPFFLYLPFHTIHRKHIAADQYRDFYLRKFNSTGQAYSNMTKELLRIVHYYGAITAMDEVIGLLRNLLQELGIKNNTLFWFTSDNGPTKDGSTNGLRGLKRSLYEGGVRVPGIIEWPDVISSNRVSQFPVVTSDLLPTVQDILGVNHTGNRPIDGISILPFLKGRVENRTQPIFSAFKLDYNIFQTKHRFSVTTDKYKLVGDKRYRSRIELFDLEKDASESVDIRHTYPDIASQLLKQFEQWKESVKQSIKAVDCIVQ